MNIIFLDVDGVLNCTYTTINYNGITGIEEVTLGSLVTTVANSAYINCSNLHTVNFLGDVKSINSKAFSYCFSTYC